MDKRHSLPFDFDREDDNQVALLMILATYIGSTLTSFKALLPCEGPPNTKPYIRLALPDERQPPVVAVLDWVPIHAK